MEFDYEMRLHGLPFNNILNGKQKIEGRLNDEKRKGLKEGNIIRFYKRPDFNEFFDAKITELKKYDSFENMFRDLGPEIFGCDSGYTLDDFVKAYRKYYSESDEKKFGVLGIGLKVLN